MTVPQKYMYIGKYYVALYTSSRYFFFCYGHMATRGRGPTININMGFCTIDLYGRFSGEEGQSELLLLQIVLIMLVKILNFKLKFLPYITHCTLKDR